MFVETAVKNVALESILINSDSESIQDMYDNVVCGYNNAPESATPEQKFLGRTVYNIDINWGIHLRMYIKESEKSGSFAL